MMYQQLTRDQHTSSGPTSNSLLPLDEKTVQSLPPCEQMDMRHFTPMGDALSAPFKKSKRYRLIAVILLAV